MAIPTLPTFVNGQAPALDAGNLNAIGTAVKDAHARLDATTVVTPILNYVQINGTNQTANVQAAVNATPTGGTLDVPPGAQIRVDGQINVNRAMTIRSTGRGGFFSGAGTAAQKMFNVTADNVAFDNLTIVGSQYATSSEQHGIYAVGTVTARIYKLRVTNCEIHSWSKAAIWVQFVGIFTFNNNDIHDIGYVGIGVQSGSVGSMSFNRVNNITGAGWADSYGMFSSRSYGTLAAHPRTEDVAIHGNTITNVPNWAGIDSHGSRALSIVGNTVRNCHMPISMVSSKDQTDTYVFATIETAIVGNVVDAVIQGTKRSVHFIGNATELATGCILGNTVRGHGLKGNTTSGAIELTYTRGVTVSGNTVVEASPVGIVVNFNNYGFAITGNTVTDPWSDSLVTKAIWVDGNNNTGVIAGNTLATAGKTAAFTNINGLGVGVRETATGTEVVVGPNMMSAAQSPYYDSGALQKASLGFAPTITGSRGGNAALAALLTQLAAKGLIVNNTT